MQPGNGCWICDTCKELVVLSVEGIAEEIEFIGEVRKSFPGVYSKENCRVSFVGGFVQSRKVSVKVPNSS